MIKVKNKNVAVLGFGIEGKDITKYLLNKRAKVSIYDKKKERELDFSGFDKKRLNLNCGNDYMSLGLSGFDIIFRSPGVYRYAKEIVEAEKKGTEISSALKLFLETCPAKVIGVTGTKGKGTASTLIYQILKKSGKDVYLAGNIGKPYLELLQRLKANSLVVMEVSSFQLIDVNKSPEIAVILNITQDHLDWHKNVKEYVDAKKNIAKYQNTNDSIIINADYKTPKDFEKLTKSNVYYFSKQKKVKGSYITQGKIVLNINKEITIGKTSALKLRGEHNWENVTAAVCASYVAGADIDSIKKIVFSFRGLEHRLEEVSGVGGVKFYNDSFSTNSDTTIAAIRSFQEPLTLILGGSDKGLEYDELANMIIKRGNVKAVILIGEILGVFEKALKKANYSGKLLILKKAKIDEIVKTAYKNTVKGGIVLLSPATASFDMFENYKDRGKQFKKAVMSIEAD